ncbi:MAG: PKD domain-containing protein [Methanocalculus sp.]|uniref:PKD domain-containing protein n=1 Tax=Methanocalculus sp. TaxID=2004547 RepID=UPI00271F6DA7|nr:PKD domain-containing protein [Methanocalculus sp.]MDO9540077.1 PKD domain-containing protein [Methanocalculus sp.]
MRWLSLIVIILCLFLIPGVLATGLEPVSIFSASPSSGPAPLTVQFADLSEGSPTSWLWLFGDGGSSTLKNPSYTYADEGIYDVILTTTNTYGQSTSQRVKYIRVGLEPTPNFIATPLLGSPPHEVRFTDLSDGSPTSWLWLFGDGDTSTAKSPTHIYTQSGRYDVVLRVSNVVGTSDRIKEQYITVGYPPTAEMKASATTGHAPILISFTDLSPNAPTHWLWSFGDGGSSTLQHPTHTYTTSGTYEVTLTVDNLFGTDTNTLQTDIVVLLPVTVAPTYAPGPGPSGTPPVANFTGTPRTGDAPLTVRFTDTSIGGPNWWRWDFGDGLLSSEMSPVHLYSSPGTYTVTLIVKNDHSSDSKMAVGFIVVTGDEPAPVTETPQPTVSPVTAGGGGSSQLSGTGGASSPLKDVSSTGSTSLGDGFIHSWWWIILILILIIIGVAAYWWKYMRKSRADGWF